MNGARLDIALKSARGRLAARVRRPDWLALAIICLAAAGVALVLFRQSVYGVRVIEDSIHYIAMARNLLEGDWFRSWDGTYRGEWAPLTSFALAAVGGFGLADPHDVAGPLNAAAFGLSILVAGAWLRRRVKSKWLVVWACASVVLARPAVEMAAWAYSEPVFILTGLLALFWADRHFEDGKRSSLLLSAAFCALHCLSRYMGVAALFTVIALIALRPAASRKERLANAAAYALIAAAPLCLWLAGNYLSYGFLMRPQDVSDTAIWEWIIPMSERVSEWWTPFIPFSPSVPAAISATICALAVAGALAVWTFARRLRAEGDGRRFVLLTAGFSFAYMALLLWGLTTGSVGLDRYVAPLFIPLTLAAAFFLDRALSSPSPDARRPAVRGLGAVSRAVQNARASAWLAPSVAVALAIWMAYGAVVSARHNWRETTAQGEAWRGWTWPPWSEMRTTAYMRDRAEGGWVFSNVAPMLYILSDESAAYRHAPRGDIQDFATEIAERRAAPSETLVAWFHLYNPPAWMNYRYNAAWLRTFDGLEPVASFYDGDVFRLNPDYKPPPMPSGATPPLAESHFDVYAEGGALIYEKKPCAEGDVVARFFVRALPVDLTNLPAKDAANGYGNLDFNFARYGAMIGDRCVIRRPLPDYALRGVEVGQWIIGGAAVWSATSEFPPDESALSFYRAEYQLIAADGEPATRMEYAVYLKDGALFYLKDDCQESHARGRFLLSVFPKNAKDLPENRRETGHDVLNFNFARYGVMFDGKCLIRRPLPDYPIESVEIGRWIPGEREVWRVRVEIPSPE